MGRGVRYVYPCLIFVDRKQSILYASRESSRNSVFLKNIAHTGKRAWLHTEDRI